MLHAFFSPKVKKKNLRFKGEDVMGIKLRSTVTHYV